MARKNNPIIGCLLLSLLIIGAGTQLFKYHPAAGVAGVIGSLSWWAASLCDAAEAL